MEYSNVGSPMQQGDIDSPVKIRLLVDSFYIRVRKNEQLAPIFEQFIENWETHLPTMYQFWERLLFGSEGYSGSPLERHVVLPIEKQHFNTWIQIFNHTVNDNFAGQKAEEAKRRARNIATVFQLQMGMEP